MLHILMEYFYLGSVSCITALVFLKNSKHRTDINENESDSVPTEKDEAHKSKLRSLQSIYLPAHLLALFSDWLQGPYVYQLYREYGHGEKEIAVLFMTGQSEQNSAIQGCQKYWVLTYLLCQVTSPPVFSAASPGPWLTSMAARGSGRSSVFCASSTVSARSPPTSTSSCSGGCSAGCQHPASTQYLNLGQLS